SAPAGDGGGLLNLGTAKLINCTVSGNSAGNKGGGLLNASTGQLTLINCTVSGNSAAKGGGLYNDHAATLTDTIVAGTTHRANVPSPSDIAGANDVSGTCNLIGPGGSGGLRDGVNGNIVLTSLQGLGLAALGNYGGPTRTMALLPGSAAIGKGTPVSGVT